MPITPIVCFYCREIIEDTDNPYHIVQHSKAYHFHNRCILDILCMYIDSIASFRFGK